MALILMKFGGTSLGTVELIEQAAERIIACREQGNDVLAVCSAMGAETDRLAGLAAALDTTPDPREMDVLLSSGEQVSIALLAMALRKRGCDARSCLGGQVPIITEPVHAKARIAHVGTQRLRAYLSAGVVPVVAGFQGVNEQGDITTFGRGGSDTTAVALAVALEADECQILSDVAGVYTTDPRLVDDARLVRRMSFEEMIELAGQGSRVLQIRAVEFAGKNHMPLRVMASNGADPGTRIGDEDPSMEAPLVSGVAFQRDEARITVTNVPHEPGMAHRVLAPVAAAHIEVDMIVLNAAQTGLVDLSFTVNRADLKDAARRVREAVTGLPGCDVRENADVVKIAVVGVGMRSNAGIAARMFEALAAQNINVRMVSTSEIKISVLVDRAHLERGVRCLHRAFGLADPPEA